jgi:hypothetical protein
MGHEFSLADIAAASGGTNNEMWNNPFIYLVWLAVLGGGGLFGGRYGAGDPAVQGALTRSDLFEGFNTQEVNAQLRGITNGLCDGFYAINGSLKDGFYGTQATVKDGFYGVETAICGTNRNIDGLRFDMSKGFCDVAGAIHAEGEATRALINQNTIQELRDKLEARDRDIMVRDFQLSQQAQNAYLVNEIRPCARPAYITCSPYTTQSFCGCGV